MITRPFIILLDLKYTGLPGLQTLSSDGSIPDPNPYIVGPIF